MWSTNAVSAPTIFQTYLLPVIPFRRRKSSTDSNASTPSTSSASSSPSESPSSDPFFSLPAPTPVAPSFLRGHTSRISCSRCHADLALTSQIISKGFTGRHGRAYLVSSEPSTAVPVTSRLFGYGRARSSACVALPNTNTHKPIPRHLVTGLHTVCDISCALCGTVLGWKYVSAEDESQRYKVGKFILETKRVVVGSCWEDVGGSAEEAELGASSGPMALDDNLDEQLPMPPRQMGSNSTSSVCGKRILEDEIMFDSQDEDECEDLFAGVWTPQLARRRRNRRINSRM